MTITTLPSLQVLLRESPFQAEHAAVVAAGTLPDGEWLAEALLARTPRVVTRLDCPRGELTWSSCIARADTAAGAAVVSASGRRWRDEALAGALHSFSDMGQALVSLRWAILASETMTDEEDLDALRSSVGAGIVLDQQNHAVPKLPCDVPPERGEHERETLLRGITDGKIQMAGPLARTAESDREVLAVSVALMDACAPWVRAGRPTDLSDIHLMSLAEAVVFLSTRGVPLYRLHEALAQQAAYVAWYRNERLDTEPVKSRARPGWWEEHVSKLEAPQWRTRIAWIHRVKLLAASLALQGQVSRGVEGAFQRALDFLEQTR